MISMQFDVIAVLPGLVESAFREGILKRAQEEGTVVIRAHPLRDFAEDPHRRVDDYPYGGGAGMVLKPEPLFRAVEEIERKHPAGKSRVILMSPQGRLLNHGEAVRLSLYKRLIIICGRYEGVDERVREHLVDEEISIGDYVLTGGEPAAAVLVDAVARLVPGTVGNPSSVLEDSFVQGELAVPHYTRPPVFRGHAVPEVLLSGDHDRVERWRHDAIRENTARRRPDLQAATRRTAERAANSDTEDSGEE